MGLEVSTGTALALLAAGAWGVWALFTKLATRTLVPEAVLVISYSVAILMGGGYLLATTGDVAVDTVGLGYAAAAGVATGAGSLLFYTSLRYGSVSVASTLVGLYFVVAAVLGVAFLGEAVTLRKVLGIGFAVVAVVLLAG